MGHQVAAAIVTSDLGVLVGRRADVSPRGRSPPVSSSVSSHPSKPPFAVRGARSRRGRWGCLLPGVAAVVTGCVGAPLPHGPEATGPARLGEFATVVGPPVDTSCVAELHAYPAAGEAQVWVQT
jgi:hypothetical protein